MPTKPPTYPHAVAPECDCEIGAVCPHWACCYADEAVPENVRSELMAPATPIINWTAREAFAAAYCWAEFSQPEDRDDTPETYWMRISEKARSECRSVANNLMLLSIARGQAVALPPANSVPARDFAMIRDALGLTRETRVLEILRAVYRVFRRTP